MKIKTFFRILFNFDCWIRNKRTSKELSKFINDALDNNSILDLSESGILKINNVKLWRNNYPYDFGYIQSAPECGMPDRETVFRLHDAYIEQLQKHHLK